MKKITKSERETFEFAKSLSTKVKPGDIFLICGDLGAGKSVFVRGLSRGLDIDQAMPSPTFTIVNEYAGKLPVFHFDLYRIHDPFELYEIGFEDYIYSDGVSFIEWPDKAGDLIPEESIKVTINIIGETREISILWNQ